MITRSGGKPRKIVLQSFRQQNVPEWIDRCIGSVKRWAVSREYEYTLAGNEIFDLCGEAYLARVGGNVRSITNLARLEMTRLKLAEGYDSVVWLDADVFVFDPIRFDMSIDAGYAFGRQVWIYRARNGSIAFIPPCLHNAALVFTPRQNDLELFIHIIRHIVMTREIKFSYQVGVGLLSGLAYALSIPALRGVGMFSRDLINAIAEDDRPFVRAFALAHGAKLQAANLGLSGTEPGGEGITMKVMDILEATGGDVVNAHVGGPAKVG